MIALDPPFRQATHADARALADLVHFASEGLALHVWTKVAGPGGNPWEVGRERARRAPGSFSYRNTVVAEDGGRIAAALIGYPLPERPEPIPQDMPAMFVPLQELENLAPGAWYVNVLAAYPEHRGRGHGTASSPLPRSSRLTPPPAVEHHRLRRNEGARRLYRAPRYRGSPAGKVKEDWDGPGTHWVLLVKQA
jgi:hypothetical protein